MNPPDRERERERERERDHVYLKVELNTEGPRRDESHSRYISSICGMIMLLARLFIMRKYSTFHYSFNFTLVSLTQSESGIYRKKD